MFRTEDLVEESGRKRGVYPAEAPHTECDELSSCRSVNSGQEKKHKSTLHLYIFVVIFTSVRGLQSRFFSRKCLSVSSVNSGQEKKHKSTLHLYMFVFLYT